MTTHTMDTKPYEVMGEMLLNIVGLASQDEDYDIAHGAVCKIMKQFARDDGEGSICTLINDLKLTHVEWEVLKAKELLIDYPSQSDEQRQFLAELLQNTFFRTAKAPFIRDKDRLYIERNFAQEAELSKILLRAIHTKPSSTEPPQELLNAFCTMNKSEDLYFQEKNERAAKATNEAIKRCFKSNFSIITGGPGTGKTTAVVKLLACLLEIDPELKICLAAPTGKAAARMLESVQNSIDSNIEIFARVKERLSSIEARTIDKWLVTKLINGQCPGPQNLWPIDVLIVDEASMIDLPQAMRLLKTIDFSHTRVIFLGDKFQLAAVGPGSVLGDLTDRANNLISPVTSHLEISFRFDENSAIGKLAYAINHYNPDSSDIHLDDVFDQSSTNNKDSIERHWIKSSNIEVSKEVSQWCDRWVEDYIKAVLLFQKDFAKEPQNALPNLWRAVNHSRLLTAQRHSGANNLNAINRLIESKLKSRLNLTDQAANDFNQYTGRIVIVRKNDDRLGVFNGDVGVMIPSLERDKRFEVYFGDKDQKLAADLLPEHENAFVLTIHQSQGSEFADVAVVLPSESGSSLSSRELLYTGITRAKESVTLFATPEILEQSLKSTTERKSGLITRCQEVIF